MKSSRRDKIVVVLAFVFLMNGFVITVKADPVNLGSLTVWESMESSVGRWNQSMIRVGDYDVNSNPSFSFAGSVANATVKWTSALSIIISSYSGIDSTVTIPAYGGTMADLISLGFVMSDSYGGVSKVTGYTEGNWYFGTTPKAGVRITAAQIGIADAGLSNNYYTSIATHELGHALGWLGHSIISYDVMWQTCLGVTTLSTAEKLHLSQVY